MWFWKSKEASLGSAEVIRLLDHALQITSPRRFIIPSDSGWVLQPILSMLNQMSGREKAEWFSPLDFGELTASVQTIFRQGNGERLVKTFADGDSTESDLVIIAMLRAIEFRMRNLTGPANDVIEIKARELTSQINRTASRA